MEWFSRTLNGAVSDGYISPYKIKRGNLNINHLLYADDMLLFTNGAKDSIKNLLSLVKDFGIYSGQVLNASKSMIIFPKHFPPVRKEELLSITGFAEKTFPIMYLGVPLYRGRIKLEYYEPVVQRLCDRIKGWSKKYLSMGGRVTLVNSVLNSISVHNMMVLPFPAKIIDRLTSIISGFIWDNGEVKKRHWVGWDRVTLSKDLGGLGVKKPGDIQTALQGKRAWIYMQRKSLWSRFAAGRFRERERGSIVWNSFRHLLEGIRFDTVWRIGGGDILIGEMCDRLSWNCPTSTRMQRVREVLGSVTWEELIDGWPIPVRDLMRRATISDGEDSIFWKKGPDGILNTKLFWDSFQTKGNPKPWVNRVWNTVLPPKIACFVWKVIHNAIPTDDNIAKLGINMPSKCVCCQKPVQETIDHLLFKGDWAKSLWRLLTGLFNKPLVRNIEDMLSDWFNDDEDDYISHIGTIMAAAGIWELWKARNSFRFEERHVDWKKTALTWPTRLAFLIKKPYSDGFQNRQLLQVLRIHPP